MLMSRIILKRQASYLKWSYIATRRFSQTAEESAEITINLDVRLAPLSKKKPPRQPFVKNLFVAKFDNEVLAYPEVLSNERQKQFEEWLAPIEESVDRHFDPDKTDENILPFEGIEELRELGVFRANLSEEDKGIGLSSTEYARLVEILGKNPALATYVTSRTDPIEILLKFGNEEQKKRYIPRFVSGDLISTLAVLEENTNKHISPVGATAVVTECQKYWKLNADKIFVTNGNQANCFIVLANSTETDDPFHKPEAPTVFITEREHGGISSNAVEKLGQRALEACTVNFKNTLLPRENLIDIVGSGPKIMMNLLTLGKQNVGSQAIAILRRFIDSIAIYAIKKRHYDQQLMSYDFAQEIIAKMTKTLYAIESMTYLTTGLMDEYEDQDVGVECAIVAAFSARECVAQVYEGLQLIEKQCYLKGSPFERLYRDASALTLFNGSNMDLYTYIAVMGLHHTGVNKAEIVHKHRNPLMFPKFIIKEIFMSKHGPDLAIEEDLHPSLLISAKMLQHSVHLLNESTEIMLVNHGNEVSHFHMELRRLANMVMDIYAMTAALARSSRSYCIGLRHSDDDIIITHTICFEAYKRVQANHEEIITGSTQNCDDTYKSVSRRIFQQKGYFPQHPLKKNF